MAVRGAPAIGIAAAWGVVLAARSGDDLPTAIRGLRASRPTAVNLAWALNRMQAALGSAASVDVDALAGVAAALQQEDRLLTQGLSGGMLSAPWAVNPGSFAQLEAQ